MVDQILILMFESQFRKETKKGIIHFEIKIDLKSMSYIKNVTLQLKTHRIDSLS